MPKTAKLVRYVSPFGSPASMTLEKAEAYRDCDLKLWQMMSEEGLLSERDLRVGEPRIGDDIFHLTDLPVWDEPTGNEFELIRVLVRQAESRARDRGEPYVVAERSGKFAMLPKRLVIDGDDVRWETR